MDKAKKLNTDERNEILKRSFVLCYKLKEYTMASKIRMVHQCILRIWEGEHLADSRERLNDFSSIYFEQGWRTQIGNSSIIVEKNHFKVISLLFAKVTKGLSYKFEFEIDGTLYGICGCDSDGFSETLAFVFEIYINLENSFPIKNLPTIRLTIDQSLYLFKDQESDCFHLGCETIVLVKDALNSDLKTFFKRKKIQYFCLQRFKLKYNQSIEDSLQFLKQISYSQSAMSINMNNESQIRFADESYRLDTIRNKSQKRLSFQLPNEIDFSSFFVLVEFYNSKWRFSVSTDQYMIDNWIICNNIDTVIFLLEKAIVPNLFSVQEANLLYFEPDMSFFTFSFKSVQGLLCLYTESKFEVMANKPAKKLYFNCHNGYCQNERCKFSFYFYKDNNKINMAYKNLLLVQDVYNNPIKHHLQHYSFLSKLELTTHENVVFEQAEHHL